MRGREREIAPAVFTIDRSRAELTVADKPAETFEHDCDRDRLWDVGETIAERIRAQVRATREDAPRRENERLLRLRHEMRADEE